MFTRVIRIGNVSLQALTLYIPVATVILLIALHFLIHKTKTGLGMRAAAKDHDTARLMGVDVNRTITITFAIGSILAAFGGIMWGMKFPQIVPQWD
jgi:branched-chain amino acid transport system permease protein